MVVPLDGDSPAGKNEKMCIFFPSVALWEYGVSLLCFHLIQFSRYQNGIWHLNHAYDAEDLIFIPLTALTSRRFPIVFFG